MFNRALNTPLNLGYVCFSDVSRGYAFHISLTLNIFGEIIRWLEKMCGLNSWFFLVKLASKNTLNSTAKRVKRFSSFTLFGGEFKVFIIKKNKKEITRNLKECAFIAIPRVSLGIPVHISTVASEWNWRTPTMVLSAVRKFFRI